MHRLTVRARAWSWGAVLCLLIFWISRTHNLLVLPTFLDEASHITRAQWVWQGRPFYLLETGKALAPYLAALFWPFTAPMFIGRYVVVLLGAIGLAAVYAVGRELHSRQAGLLAMALWLAAPEMIFFERMALVDTTVSSMAMLTLWLAIRMIRSGRIRTAVLCGVGLALCVLAKTTGLVFFPIPVLVVVLVSARTHWLVRARQALIAYIVAAVLLAGPLLYVLSVAADPLGLSNGVVTTKTATFAERVLDNAAKLRDAEFVYYTKPMLWVMLAAASFALTFKIRTSLLLLALVLAPLLAIILAAASLWLRYASPAAPFMLLLSAIGMLTIVQQLQRFRNRRFIRALPWLIAAAFALLVGLPFLLTAYRDPTQLPLPEGDVVEYIQWIPSGYGIREAAQYLQQEFGTQPITVIGTAVNCHGARLYMPPDTPIKFICPDLDWGQYNWNVIDMIRERADQDGQVYVLGEDVPIVPEHLLPRPFTILKEFQRPGASYTVKLYRVDRDTSHYRGHSAPNVPVSWRDFPDPA